MSQALETSNGASEARPTDAPLPMSTIVAYSVPALGVAFPFILMTLFFTKYSTDVLLVAPGVVGLLFGISRIWDAVSDPLAGYLSDRTRSRLGRRRSWMFASSIPLAATFIMLWNPPAALSGWMLTLWTSVALFGFFTAYTVFAVPHEAMGAELTPSYHDRTRLFGIKYVIQTTGAFLALGSIYLLTRADDPRAVASWLTTCGAVALIGLIVLPISRLRERSDYQGRGGTGIWRSFGDVVRNRHARLLLIIFGIENLGSASIGILAPYVAEYVVKAKEYTSAFLALYFIPSILFVPVWIRVSRWIGKKRLWFWSMVAMCFGFGGLFFLEEGDVWLICFLAFVAGTGGGCGNVVGPSIKADVIDFDELQTGERKEGAYFAVWNFVRKTALGITVMLTGFVLQVSGFEPNVEQTENAKTAMLAIFGLFPGACYAIGAVLFARFSLNEAEHGEIRRQLDAAR